MITTCPVKSWLTPLDTEGRRGLWQHYKKTTWPFVCVCFLVFCTCVHTCVRVCVIMCAWMCGCVKLDTILYNTAHICHGGELTHELNRDKEQIYLKQLCYILWTTVKLFFYWIQKMNLGYTYINYIYVYALCSNWERPWWTLLST